MRQRVVDQAMEGSDADEAGRGWNRRVERGLERKGAQGGFTKGVGSGERGVSLSST